ncbi:MAG TPA: pyrroline-5-carboxylate reductase [Stellaceae bacterium]|nr:pyrroline-5-carboxylate reductase [Stellaceae bacterium]
MSIGERPTLLLVGCGKMGGALLSGWMEADFLGGVAVVEPAGDAAGFVGDPRVMQVRGAAELDPAFRPSVIVLAVKPQVMEMVAPAFARHVGPETVVLSIAAGRTLRSFDRLFPQAAIIRAMPNTPAAVGRGITVAVANRVVTQEQRALCDRLLAAVGAVEWVDEEALIDAVTALSGGGPAYVFLLIEVLAGAGAAAGLPPDLAMRLARATVAGSGELARLSDQPADVLRRNVTSPNGTTQAALDVLMGDAGVAPLFRRAIAAATARSRELAQ